ncbi:hypothetical protein BJY04DRAFT_181597 [Aspergillus karnatakaensis]|uniref:uncharacterized protein n=1 Tax=Aspergillus karnatakaensis TaxID=1810916 RepID=UPI003CCDE343
MLASLSYNQINLGDSATGDYLETIQVQLPIRSPYRSLRFMNDNPYLDTDRGRIRFTATIPDEPEVGQELPHCLYIEEDWITQHGKKFLWIPPEMRSFTDYVV